jgi:hypothetical protein
MSNQKKVIIEVFTDGSSKVDSSGFQGNSCTLATKELELALAGEDPSNRDDKKKPDFYATTGNSNTLRN